MACEYCSFLDQASYINTVFKSIPQKQKVQLGALRKIADHVKNYSEYRSKLRNTSPPAVPFMGKFHVLSRRTVLTFL